MPTDGARRIPPAEIDVEHDLVTGLIASQHPDLAGLELRAFANGWDNVIFRLGDEMTVRLPRRAAGAVLVEHEQRWLPELATRLPLPIPSPLRIGRPELGYPWSWSITPWFDGEVAADSVLVDPTREARRLGEFMSALHISAPTDAPANPARDGFIGDRHGRYEAALAPAAGVLHDLFADGVTRARNRWLELTHVDPFVGRPIWVAGDVHSANLVVEHGEIRAVIDFGDLCAGDPAVDLAVAWMLFDDSDRHVFRNAASRGEVEVDDTMWLRAEGWALYFAVLYLANSADDARLERMGRGLTGALLA